MWSVRAAECQKPPPAFPSRSDPRLSLLASSRPWSLLARSTRAVHVLYLADVESISTHGGPRSIVFVQAESISKAHAMISVLRAKGLLRKKHGGGGAGADVFEDDDIDYAYAEEGSGADDEWGGWVAEAQKDPDLRLVLERIVSDDFDPDHEGGGANGAHHDDVVAHGWRLENASSFFRAVDLGITLEEVAAYVVPLLVRNPADPAALRRLRTHGRAIRRVGKQLPRLMGQAPVTLGNYLQNVAGEALRRGSGGAAWMASRCDKVLARVMGLYEEERVSFVFS